jgi:hypothetical protein
MSRILDARRNSRPVWNRRERFGTNGKTTVTNGGPDRERCRAVHAYAFSHSDGYFSEHPLSMNVVTQAESSQCPPLNSQPRG